MKGWRQTMSEPQTQVKKTLKELQAVWGTKAAVYGDLVYRIRALGSQAEAMVQEMSHLQEEMGKANAEESTTIRSVEAEVLQ